MTRPVRVENPNPHFSLSLWLPRPWRRIAPGRTASAGAFPGDGDGHGSSATASSVFSPPLPSPLSASDTSRNTRRRRGNRGRAGAPLAPLPARACTRRCAHRRQAAQWRRPLPLPPAEVVFFVSMPRLADVHGDREERARPYGGASLPAAPVRLYSFSLFFALCSFRVRDPVDGDFLLLI
jgi:hypothetical protein